MLEFVGVRNELYNALSLIFLVFFFTLADSIVILSDVCEAF